MTSPVFLKLSVGRLVVGLAFVVTVACFILPATDVFRSRMPHACNRTGAPGVIDDESCAPSDSDSDSQDIDSSDVPAFLKDILPKRIHGGLAVKDVEGPDGKLKLIAWCSGDDNGQTAQSRLQLISFESPSKPKIVWESKFEQYLYAPDIKLVPAFRYHGYPVFMIKRQAGAAAMLVSTLCVMPSQGRSHKVSVQEFPEMFADYFDLQVLRGSHSKPALRLIGHARPIASFETPTVYDWTAAGGFVPSTDVFPDYFLPLVAENKEYFSGRDLYWNCIGAELLDRAGKGAEAVKLVQKVKRKALECKDEAVVYSCMTILEKAGKRREALALALALRSMLKKRIEAKDGYVGFECLSKCATVLAHHSRKRVALSLLETAKPKLIDEGEKIDSDYEKLIEKLKSY